MPAGLNITRTTRIPSKGKRNKALTARSETTPNTSPEIASNGVLARTRYRPKRTGFGIRSLMASGSGGTGAGRGVWRSVSITSSPPAGESTGLRCRRMGRPGARIGFPLSVGSEARVVTLIHASGYVPRIAAAPRLSSAAGR